MKILIFIPHMGLGGVERSFINLSKEFRRGGHNVKFVSLNDIKSTYNEDIKHIKLNSKRTVFSINKLSKIFNYESPDLIISAQYYANIIAVISNKISKNKAKIIISERNHLSSELKKLNYFKRLIISSLVKFFYRKADLIYGNSDEVCNDLKKNFNLKIKIKKILNPSFTENIERLSKEKVHDEWITKANVPLLAYVGRLEPQKDIDTLLKSFEILNRHHDSKLLIIGDGSEKEKLLKCTNEIKAKIKHINFDENPYKYIKHCNILLLTSIYEGMPNILIEAQVMKMPIVATNCPGGTSEALLNGDTGLLAKTGDPKDIANKILELINDEEIKNKFILNYQKSIERFDPKKTVKVLLEEVRRF